MKDLESTLNKIYDQSNSLVDGDLIALSNINNEVVKHEDFLSKDKAEIKEFISNLESTINAAIKSEINNFTKFKELLADSIYLFIKHLNFESDKIDLDDYKKLELKLLTLTAEDEEELNEEAEEDSNAFCEDVELIENFFNEAEDYFEQIESSVLSLEHNPFRVELLDVIFRAFHTIKGVSAFVNFTEIHFISHETESLIELIRSEQRFIESSHLELILDHVDLMRKLIVHYKNKMANSDYVIPAIDEENIKEKILDLSEKKKIISRKKIGEIILEQGELDDELLDEILEKKDELGPKKIGEILIQSKKLSSRQILNALRIQRQTTEIIDSETEKVSKIHDENKNIKISAQKLDNLLDLVGELVISNNQVLHNETIKVNKNERFIKDTAQLKRVVADLQKLSMSLRMVQMGQTFHKIKRQVHDLSKKNKKQVNLVLLGDETEIDRNVVDEIYEPLIHIIRNAIDHGLEETEDREKLKKTEQGLLEISAYHQGGDVIIKIRDDGKGIDTKKVYNKAKSLGIVNEDFDEIKKEELLSLIFNSGFSTADKVTDVSGRGVGMNIVKTKIESLRGKVQIETEDGKGTSFFLKIPLTMAIIDGIVVRIGTNKYVVPTLNVIQLLKLDNKKYFTLENKGEMINIREQLVPLVRLYKILKVKPEFEVPEEAMILLIEHNNKFKCFMVDEILDKQEIVVKTLGNKLKEVQGISSGTILGDGKVGLILDINGIFKLLEVNTFTNDNLTKEKVNAE